MAEAEIVGYSLRWIRLERCSIPFIRTWQLSRTDEQGRRYLSRVRRTAEGEFPDESIFRVVPESRLRGGLLTLEQLAAAVRVGISRARGCRRVAYHVFGGPTDTDPRLLIITEIIRKHDCGECCPPDCVAKAELYLRRGRLVARRKPVHSRGEYANKYSCSFDRLDHSIKAVLERQRRVSAIVTPPPPPPKHTIGIGDGTPADLEGLADCEVITVSDHKAPDLSCLAAAVRATKVYFWRGELKGSQVDAFRSMPRLEKLILNEPTVSEAALRRLQWLQPRTEVTLTLWGASDEQVQLLARIPGLTNVSFRAPHVSSLSLRKLTRCVSLRSLNFTYGRVTSFGAALLPRLPKLQRLSLAGCRISRSAMLLVGQCSELESLDLSVPRMSDRYCQMLAELPQLKKLVIDGTSVSDLGLSLLAACSTLTELSIRRTARISRAGIGRFQQGRPDVQLKTGTSLLLPPNLFSE